MPRRYHIERNAIIQRWYGGNPQPRNPRPRRSWRESPVTPADCLGVPIPANSPFRIPGYCMVWKYRLTQDGYGYLTVDGKRELAHRVAFIQTRGQIRVGKQVNHLCNRPYCVQPSHLYAGTKQDNKDDSQIFGKEELLHARPGTLIGRTTRIPTIPCYRGSCNRIGMIMWNPGNLSNSQHRSPLRNSPIQRVTSPSRCSAGIPRYAGY